MIELRSFVPEYSIMKYAVYDSKKKQEFYDFVEGRGCWFTPEGNLMMPRMDSPGFHFVQDGNYLVLSESNGLPFWRIASDSWIEEQCIEVVIKPNRPGK